MWKEFENLVFLDHSNIVGSTNSGFGNPWVAGGATDFSLFVRSELGESGFIVHSLGRAHSPTYLHPT